MTKNSENILVSVIVATYNEDKCITECLISILSQTYSPLELIVVDDGSVDKTVNKVKSIFSKESKERVTLIKKNHAGPGEARNLGAKRSHGEILVFLDGDMVFTPSFIDRLTKPIIKLNAIGAESPDEYLYNPVNYWARNWNLGRFAAAGVVNRNYLRLMVPNLNNFGGTYRAILKSEFVRIGGFELGGDYNDDESLYRKIGRKAYLVKNAKFYHRNPSSILEIWERASWIGSGRNFTGSVQRKILGIVKYSLPVAFIKGLVIGFKFGQFNFVLFKLFYDSAIWFSIIRSL